MLVGKWCWRLLVERDGLWRKVLVARYGVVGGGLEVWRMGAEVVLLGGGR